MHHLSATFVDDRAKRAIDALDPCCLLISNDSLGVSLQRVNLGLQRLHQPHWLQLVGGIHGDAVLGHRVLVRSAGLHAAR